MKSAQKLYQTDPSARELIDHFLNERSKGQTGAKLTWIKRRFKRTDKEGRKLICDLADAGCGYVAHKPYRLVWAPRGVMAIAREAAAEWQPWPVEPPMPAPPVPDDAWAKPAPMPTDLLPGPPAKVGPAPETKSDDCLATGIANIRAGVAAIMPAIGSGGGRVEIKFVFDR